MTSYDPWLFLSLLVPPNGSRLLMIGYVPSLLERLAPSWKEIQIYVHENQRRSLERGIEQFSLETQAKFVLTQSLRDLDPEAMIISGLSPYGWNEELPSEVSGWMTRLTLAIGREATVQRWRLSLPSQWWILTGVPFFRVFPRCWIPSGSPTIPASLFSPRGRVERQKLKIDLFLKRIGGFGLPYALFVNPEKSTLKRILDTTTEGKPDSPGVLWYATKKDFLFIFMPDVPSPVVVKIPLTSTARSQLTRHYRNLGRMKELFHEQPISNLLPNAFSRMEAGYAVGVESIASGRPAFQFFWSRKKLRRIMEESCQILIQWQNRNAKLVSINETLFSKYFYHPLLPIRQALEEKKRCDIFDNCLHVLREKFLNKCLPLVPAHGDFWLNNLLWDEEKGEISAILDWDECTEQGLPLLDLFHLLYWRTSSFYDIHSRWILFLTLKQRFPGYRGRLIREYCQALSIEENFIPWLFTRYWLGEASKKIEGLFDGRETMPAFIYLNKLLKKA